MMHTLISTGAPGWRSLPLFGRALLAALALVTGLYASGCADPSPPSSATAPTIARFEAAPALIAPGEPSTLVWTVEDVTEVTILDGAEVLGTFQAAEALSGSLEVTPSGTTTYTLEAVNAPSGRRASGTSRGEAVVTVNDAQVPTLELSVSPDAVVPGGQATLKWTVGGAETLELTANSTPVSLPTGTASGELIVTPQETTLYAMTATSAGGSVTQAVTLTVAPIPVITRFEADATEIDAGDSVALSWQTQGADSLRMTANGDTVDLTGRDIVMDMLRVTPAGTTTYVLIAGNESGEASATAEVAVASTPLPSVVSFGANPSSVLRGEPAELAWQTSDAERIELYAGDQALDVSGLDPADDTFEVRPTESTVYRLVVFNARGQNEATTSVGIDGDPSPVVDLTLAPETIDEGASATLSWQTINVTALTLTADPGPAPDISALPVGSGAIQVSPRRTTTYTLTGAGAGGEESREVTLTVNPAVLIETFSADAAQIELGGDAVLTWATANAERVELAYGDTVEVVEPSGTFTAEGLEATTTFTLTAFGVGGPTSREVTVNVRIPGTPEIRQFTASSQSVGIDETVNLSWIVSEADSLTMTATPLGGAAVPVDLGDAPVDLGGVTVDPDVTTTYTLTASNVSGDSTADVTVSVPLAVLALTAPAGAVRYGEQVELSWRVQGAVGAELRVGGGAAMPVNVGPDGRGSTTVGPIEATTEVVLTAIGPNDATADRSATILLAPPVVEAFAADPPAGATGSNFTLAWTTPGATALELNSLDSQGTSATLDVSGLDPEGDTLQVALDYTTTFTLRATNPAGAVEAEALVTVTNEPSPAQVLRFDASSTRVPSGDTITLSWTTLDATALRIQRLDPDTNAPIGQALIISPADFNAGEAPIEAITQPRLYRLIAVGTDAQEITADLQIDVDVDLGTLRMTEVFFDAPSSDDGLEWIELLNTGDRPVNLSLIVLGHGGGSFAASTQRLPDAVVPPGACVVVGGPSSDAANASPELDIPVDFATDLQNSGDRADGVALFDARDGDPSPASTPLDAVVYGAAIDPGDTFTGPNGQPLAAPDTDDVAEGRSIFRYTSPGQPLGAERLWGANPLPTPGRCFGLVPERFDQDGDAQVYGGRRRGPEQGGDLIGLRTFGVDVQNTQIFLGGRSLICANDTAGPLCEVPAGSGRTDLELRQGDGSVSWPSFYVYEPVDFCRLQFPTEIDIDPSATLPDIYGRIYQAGVTEPNGAPDGVVAQWGWGPFGSDPGLIPDAWTWFDAVYNIQEGNDDEFAVFGATGPDGGEYTHVFRFRLSNSDVWTYCDANGVVYNLPGDLSNLFSPDDAGLLDAN